MNPCPCMTLDTGVKFLAIIDIVSGTLSFGLFFSVLVIMLTNDAELAKLGIIPIRSDKEKSTIAVAMVFAMFTAILQVFLAVNLFDGANKNHYGSCRLWFIVTFIFVTLIEISLILISTSEEFNIAAFGVGVVGVIYKNYALSVVFTFMKTFG